MKKFLCILMVAVMLLGLVACTTDEDIRGSVSTDPTSEESFSLGKTKNNCYENTFLGISCTLPSEWIFYTDEEILELNNIVSDMVDEDVAKALEAANIIYDMYATNPNDYSSVNVNLEKHTATQVAAMNLKTVIEAQFSVIKSSYENMGYTDVNVQYQKITVDGKELDGAVITAKISGLQFNATLFCFKKGRYLSNVTIAAFGADKVDAILDCFTFDK